MSTLAELGDEYVSMSKNIWNIKKNCYSFYTYLGVVKSFMPFDVKIISSTLKVRAGASTSYKQVGLYRSGIIVRILQISKDGYWGKTDKGWISIKSQYVVRI